MVLGCIHGKAEACLGTMGKLKKQTLWNSQLYKVISRKALLFGEMMKKVLIAQDQCGMEGNNSGDSKKEKRH